MSWRIGPGVSGLRWFFGWFGGEFKLPPKGSENKKGIRSAGTRAPDGFNPGSTLAMGASYAKRRPQGRLFTTKGR
jgi:hypothetical protein